MKIRPPRFPRPSRAVLQATTAIACNFSLVITLNVALNRPGEIVDNVGYALLLWMGTVYIILCITGLIAGPTAHERAASLNKKGGRS